MYIYIYIYIYIYMCVCVCLSACVSACVCVSVFWENISVNMCLCLCVRMCIYVYIDLVSSFNVISTFVSHLMPSQNSCGKIFVILSSLTSRGFIPFLRGFVKKKNVKTWPEFELNDYDVSWGLSCRWSKLWIALIYKRIIGLVGKYLPIAKETMVQSLVVSYRKLKKWYLILPWLILSIIRYVFMGKVEQSRKKSSTPQHFGVVAIEKEAFGSPSTTVTNFTYLYRVNSALHLCEATNQGERKLWIQTCYTPLKIAFLSHRIRE